MNKKKPGRDDRRSGNQRSNIVWVKWGQSEQFPVTEEPVDSPLDILDGLAKVQEGLRNLIETLEAIKADLSH